MGGIEDLKQCPWHRFNCAASLNGYCKGLDDMDFKGRECPFFLTRSASQKKIKECRERLLNIGRIDLLQKYRRKGRIE